MPRNNQGITETDMDTADLIFSDAGPPPIPITQRMFRYFAPQDRWELWQVRVTGASFDAVHIATRDNSTGEWVLEP